MKKFGYILFIIITAGYLHFAMADTTQITLPNSKHSINWPPELGKPYPDLALINHKGEITRLADFKGKLILIEPIGMNCPACNAFVGGNKIGGFKGLSPQQGLKSAEEYFYQFNSKLSFDDPRIIHVQLLLYNFSMQPPDKEDAKIWAEHFGFDKKPNYYILAGGKELVNSASYNMIPGFQLVDKKFILRSDSSGHNPHDGFETLLKMIPEIINE